MGLRTCLLISLFVIVKSLVDQPAPNYGRYQNSPHCSREPTGVASVKTPGDAGYKIKISGNPERYTPGEIYTGE